MGRLHESPLGLGTSGCWECVLPRGGGRDGRRMDDGILSIPRLSLAPFRPYRLAGCAEEPQPVVLNEVGGCCSRASKWLQKSSLATGWPHRPHHGCACLGSACLHAWHVPVGAWGAT